MPPERRWILAATAAVTLGALGAQCYVKIAVPYYTVVTRLIALGHPWEVVDVKVVPRSAGPGTVLRLTGLVGRPGHDARPAAAVNSKLEVAAVVESPVIYWTILLLWPAVSHRARVGFLLLGVPIFLALEAATTGCQLVGPLASVSAMLAGDDNPMTSWDRWSRFIEGGGRVAMATGAAILTVSLTMINAKPAPPLNNRGY